MRGFLCGLAAVLLAASSGHAQSRFEGAYIGLTGGWDFQMRDAVNNYGNWGGPKAICLCFPNVKGGSESGPKAGFVAGYTWVAGQWLVGIEARGQKLWAKQVNNGQPIPNWPIYAIVDRRPKWQADVSARIGREFGDWLPFAKIGVGVEQARQIRHYEGLFIAPYDGYSRKNAVVIAGLGIERNLFQNVFARVEGEFTAHLQRDETYFAPSANVTVGLRF